MFWWIAAAVVLIGFTAFTGAPYVPSKRRDVRRAFDTLCPIDDHDVVVDLGSGDGLVLREVSRRGAQAVGYELNPLLVLISWLLSVRDTRVHTYLRNLWRVEFPAGTTVVYLFGDARDIARLTRKLEAEGQRLDRSLRVLSYGFELRGHKPVAQEGAYHLYRIPALRSNTK